MRAEGNSLRQMKNLPLCNKGLDVVGDFIGRIILFIGTERTSGLEGFFTIFREVSQREFFARFFILLSQSIDRFGT